MLAASAASYAQEPEFSDLDGVAYGIVECVREVPLHDDPAGLADVFEHAVKPYTGEELIVRLKDGRAISVVQDETELFEPGERVVVIPGLNGARAEHM